MDWMVREDANDKTAVEDGSSRERVCKAKPALTERKIMARVEVVVKNRLFRNRVPNLPTRHALRS